MPTKREGISLRIAPELNAIDLKGRRYVVTGGTSGAGEATTKFLAERGAEVITCGRSVAGAQARIDELPAEVKARITLVFCDLGDLDSVESFADTIAKRWDRLDGLVNNAGLAISAADRLGMQIGGQKYDVMFMVNHVAHHHLTNLLMPLLERNGGARVINLSSIVHDKVIGGKTKFGHIYLEDPHGRTAAHDGPALYAQSKLATHLHAVELAERYRDKRVYAWPVHPGTVEGGLGRDFEGCTACLIPVLLTLFADEFRQVTPLDGAQTTLHCLLSDEALKHVGVYHAQTGMKHRNGQRGGWPFPSPNPEAHDAEVRRKLWDLTEQTIAEVKAAKHQQAVS